MDINYTEMINHDLKALSQDNLRKAWSYVNALTTLQRSKEELKAIEYDPCPVPRWGNATGDWRWSGTEPQTGAAIGGKVPEKATPARYSTLP